MHESHHVRLLYIDLARRCWVWKCKRVTYFPLQPIHVLWTLAVTLHFYGCDFARQLFGIELFFNTDSIVNFANLLFALSVWLLRCLFFVLICRLQKLFLVYSQIWFLIVIRAAISNIALVLVSLSRRTIERIVSENMNKFWLAYYYWILRNLLQFVFLRTIIVLFWSQHSVRSSFVIMNLNFFL